MIVKAHFRMNFFSQWWILSPPATLILLPNHALFNSLQIKQNGHRITLTQLNLKEHCGFCVLLTVNPCIILQISSTGCTILLNIFISLLYMFWASMCPSSRENYCVYATLVFVTLKGGSFKLQRLLLHKIQSVTYRKHPVFYVIITFVCNNNLCM